MLADDSCVRALCQIRALATLLLNVAMESWCSGR